MHIIIGIVIALVGGVILTAIEKVLKGRRGSAKEES